MGSLVGHTVDDALVRGRSVAIALEATDDGDGVQEGDSVFELVTEGRQSANTIRRLQGSPELPYSACGDLGHHDLWQLLVEHVPDPTAPQMREALRTINRDEAGGWTSGVNVSRLVGSPAFVHHQRGGALGARPGDIVVIGEGGREHVLVVEQLPALPDTGLLTSLDYGQQWAEPGEPVRFGGRRRERAVRRGADRRLTLTGPEGTRPVLGYLDVADFIARVRAA